MPSLHELMGQSPTMAIALCMVWFAATKMKAYDKHLDECTSRKPEEYNLAYRVGQLESTVKSNHNEVLGRLDTIIGTRNYRYDANAEGERRQFARREGDPR